MVRIVLVPHAQAFAGGRVEKAVRCIVFQEYWVLG